MTTAVTRRCPRCSGLKYLYKVGNGYTTTDMGGAKVTCICCNGDGTISFDVPDVGPIVPAEIPETTPEENNLEIIKDEKDGNERKVATKKEKGNVRSGKS